MPQHRAAFIPGLGKPIEVRTVDTVSPGSDEVLIRTKAIAINPVDHIMQDYGLFVSSWPVVPGSDIAGEVIEVGDSVKTVKKGDRVLAAPVFFISGKQEHAGFQEVVVVPEVAVTKIPDTTKFEDAAVLPLSVSTAAAGLYQKDFLGLTLPTEDTSASRGKKLLIWGGSSSVGSSAVQLAVASGFDVLVTTSSKNFDYVRALDKSGNVQVFDYKSTSVVGDITAGLQGNCVGAYDAIAQRDTQLSIGTILAQLGGGKIALVLERSDELPATVDGKTLTAPSIFAPGNPVGPAIFNVFLPKALADGSFKTAPTAEVVGTGLESLQDAIKKQKAGVSAKKIVVIL